MLVISVLGRSVRKTISIPVKTRVVSASNRSATAKRRKYRVKNRGDTRPPVWVTRRRRMVVRITRSRVITLRLVFLLLLVKK